MWVLIASVPDLCIRFTLTIHYVSVSVLIKCSQKTSVFYLNYHKFSIKSYVLDVY